MNSSRPLYTVQCSMDIPLALPLMPDIHEASLVQKFQGIDQDQNAINIPLIVEQAWTVYFNAHEIVTVMTIGDHPTLLALGYLTNQQLLPSDLQQLSQIDVDHDLRVVVVRTHDTELTPTLSRQIRTSGCGEGTMFEHALDGLKNIRLNLDARLHTHDLFALLKQINQQPSLYLSAGAIHGCVLCQKQQILAYCEDIGRHNAIDKIAGLMLMNGLSGADHFLYTTGRLTTEMVLKSIQMEIPILISRSGFTAAAVELAQNANLTLIGRAKGKRFALLSGTERIIFDDVE